jgi:hypothetical protein
VNYQTVTAWLADRHPGTYSFPPSPKKFLHSFLECLKNSRSRFKSFIFFRKKLRSFDGFDQMSALWSMFWFKPFRNFLQKIAIFRTFDHWSEILSLSAGRPISQGVCPALAPTSFYSGLRERYIIWRERFFLHLNICSRPCKHIFLFVPDIQSSDHFLITDNIW